MGEDQFSADSGSFRDPSGQVFLSNGRVLRTVNPSIADDFRYAEDSGLFADLIGKGWLVDYEHTAPAALGTSGQQAAFVLEHPALPMISYAYEWPFSALKAAALLHLDVHLAALDRNMTLSDASAYNVQFIGTRPVFIDILSFVRYHDGSLWPGHKQFCEQFLNPLLLHAYFGISHSAWFRGALEGVPVEDLAALLPWWRRIAPRPLIHVVLQSVFQRRARQSGVISQTAPAKTAKLPKPALCRMLSGLRKWIAGLEPSKRERTVWESYAQETSYSDDETEQKRSFLMDFVRETNAKRVWDLGCNTGNYLIAALDAGAEYGVGFDFDHGALEAGFRRSARDGSLIQFLYLDAANPSSDQGWAQRERKGLLARAGGDAVFALALIHHLAITRNVPLDAIVDWIVALAPSGVIEFVPKRDPMVQALLRNRADIFPDYTEDAFRQALSVRADITATRTVSASGRTLYGFRRRP
jgi:ribosomal protein L11 methylase PrmA